MLVVIVEIGTPATPPTTPLAPPVTVVEAVVEPAELVWA